jgi:putative transposase
MSYEYRQFYRRKLPHIHSPGATLFVTFRLVGSIPKSVLRGWQAERSLLARKKATAEEDLEFRRKWFARFEEILDKAGAGPKWLADPAVAKVVADSLEYRDGLEYTLNAYSIMRNHVHTVFTPFLNSESLTEVRFRTH